MLHSKNFLIYSPGGDNEGGNIAADNNDKKTGKEGSSFLKREGEEKKSLGEKVHDALQEWSNDDQHDQEFDDTRP